MQPASCTVRQTIIETANERRRRTSLLDICLVQTITGATEDQPAINTQ